MWRTAKALCSTTTCAFTKANSPTATKTDVAKAAFTRRTIHIRFWACIKAAGVMDVVMVTLKKFCEVFL